MSYAKEIGKILAEELQDLVLEEELALNEIRDLDTLGAHITHTEATLGKSHGKTKGLKRLYKRKAGIEGIRNFKPAAPPAAPKMDEDELQEIRGLSRLRQSLNHSLLSNDPQERQNAMRLQALQRRKLQLSMMGEVEKDTTLSAADYKKAVAYDKAKWASRSKPKPPSPPHDPVAYDKAKWAARQPKQLGENEAEYKAATRKPDQHKMHKALTGLGYEHSYSQQHSLVDSPVVSQQKRLGVTNAHHYFHKDTPGKKPIVLNHHVHKDGKEEFGWEGAGTARPKKANVSGKNKTSMMNHIHEEFLETLDEAAKSSLKYSHETKPEERHPWHDDAVKAGLKHTATYKKGAETTHIYMPDHHWKSGVHLKTTTRKGKPDKHQVTDGTRTGDDLKSMHSFIQAGVQHHDALMAHHKAGTGPFAPEKPFGKKR